MQPKKIIVLTLIALALLGAGLGLYLSLSPDQRDGERDQDPSNSASEHNKPNGDQNTARGALRGVVLDELGDPIKAAEVQIFAVGEGDEAASEPSFRLKTDARGRFTSQALSPGQWRLDARAEGFVSPGPRAQRGYTLRIEEERDLDAIQLVLRRPAKLAGLITAAGKPVPGASIGLYYLHADNIGGGALSPFALDDVAKSDPSGRFRLQTLSPGRLRLLIQAEGYALKESREVYLSAGEDLRGFRVDLSAAGSLALQISDEQGQPVTGATALVMGQGLGRGRRLQSDASGSVSFDRLPIGEHKLIVRAPGYSTLERQPIVIKANKSQSLELKLKASSGLFGQVVDASGEGVERAVVLIRAEGLSKPRSLRADAAGRFSWEDPDRSLSAFEAQGVSARHAPSDWARIEPGEQARIVLGGSGQLQGKVIGPAGKPISQFSVGVDRVEVPAPDIGRLGALRAQRLVRNDGGFTLGPLRPGRYRLRAQARGFEPGYSDWIDLKAGATIKNIEIKIGEGARLLGEVVDAQTGKPVARARVRFFEPGSRFPPRQTRTNTSGVYSLEGIEAGRHSLQVSASGYLAQFSSGIEIPSGGEVRRTIRLEKAQKGEKFSFYGIGAVLKASPEGVQILDTLEGMPAEAFGLQKGDTIRSVDAVATRDMELGQIIELIRGEEGVSVELEINRPGEGVMTMEVERGRVVVKDRKGKADSKDKGSPKN